MKGSSVSTSTDRHPMFDQKTPITPYAGYSAPGGSAASREANREAIEDGTLNANQQYTLGLVREAGRIGITSLEIERRMNWGHGRASSYLSVLHKVGLIARLDGKRTKRDRYSVYVTPENIDGRKTAEPKGTKASKLIAEEAELRLKAERGEEAWKIVEEKTGREIALSERIRQALGIDDSLTNPGLADMVETLITRYESRRDLIRTLQSRLDAENVSRPHMTSEEAKLVATALSLNAGKPDTFVQPTRMGTLRGLARLADRLPIQ